jgi:hypothetical protein
MVCGPPGAGGASWGGMERTRSILARLVELALAGIPVWQLEPDCVSQQLIRHQNVIQADSLRHRPCCTSKICIGSIPIALAPLLDRNVARIPLLSVEPVAIS